MGDFESLLIENIPRLRRYARALMKDKEQADELVQDCLERAWSRKHLYRGDDDIRPWLFTIMHNIHANAARRYSRAPSLVSLDTVSEREQAPNQYSRLVLRDLQRRLDEFPDGQRLVVLLIGLEGLSYEETAKVLDVPAGTVMSRLSRARIKLREVMRGEVSASLRGVK